MVKTVKLKDKRTLAFEEFGDPNGRPVFYFHGWPSSRLTGLYVDKIARQLKIRIICPDRPGFGYSTFKKDRKLLDWPDDVCRLADYLKTKKFSVVGGSGGGPYVAACAYKIPQRLLSATIYAGLGPIKVKEAKGLSFDQRTWLMLASFLGTKTYPALLVYKFLINHFPGVFRWSSLFRKPGIDKKISKAKNFKRISELSFKEAFRQGVRGPALDWKIYSTYWGFDLGDIKIKINLWHGKLDKNAPFWMGKYVALNLKKCKATFLDDYGHFLITQHGKKILAGV